VEATQAFVPLERIITIYKGVNNNEYAKRLERCRTSVNLNNVG